MKAISYSIFGFGHEKYANCFDHDNYVTGLMANVRFNRVLFPNWVNVLNIDEASYDTPYRKFYDWMQGHGFLKINIFQNNEPLCRAMLQRLQPVFAYQHPDWVYTHVLCRDSDAIPTFREAQAVTQWIQEGKTLHCITDSVSHNIAMMGGMIGLMPSGFTSLTGLKTWKELMSLGYNTDFNRKNTDQEFMNKFLYPMLCYSATEHFILGMKQNIPEGDGRHYSIANIDVPNVDRKYEAPTNACGGHIGCAGFYGPPTINFLRYNDPYRDDYEEIEKQFPKLFYWRQ